MRCVVEILGMFDELCISDTLSKYISEAEEARNAVSQSLGETEKSDSEEKALDSSVCVSCEEYRVVDS